MTDVLQARAEQVTEKRSNKGYFDLPLVPRRRAFIFGKTFFMIFPKSAALNGW